MRLLEKFRSTAPEQVLAYEDFRLFSDINGGFSVTNFDPSRLNEVDRADIIAKAESWLETPFPQTLASDFIRYTREGDRQIFEGKYFKKRHMTYIFALAEAIERRGRFTDRLMDGVMLILDEQDWVIPAHIDHRYPLNPWYKEHPYIDLFAAETGSTLAFVHLVARDILDEVSPLICERLRHALHERITEAFLADETSWWLGFNGKAVNNWNPWILSNILTVCALTEPELECRRAVLDKVLRAGDNFIAVYHSDGGCDEGPSYWTAAGAALFELIELAYDFTGGHIDLFGEDLIRRMGEYEADFHIGGDYYVNFADCPVTVSPSYRMIARYGRRVGSERLRSFGEHFTEKYPKSAAEGRWMLYQSVKNMHEPIPSGVDYAPSRQAYYDGIEVMLEREESDCTKGFFLACKGGHNDESHNHNDIGSFIVYSSGRPLIVDSGSGEYTSRTFSGDRYKIWTMVSEYHNLPIINSLGQLPGAKFRAESVIYSQGEHSLALSLEQAYDPKAGLESLRRTVSLVGGVVTVRDEIALKSPGTAVLSLLCAEKPTVDGKSVRFATGETLTCSANLTPELDAAFDMDMEDGSIRKRWGRELYRVLLRTGEFTSDSFEVKLTH